MGAAVFEEEGVPYVLRYEVRCDVSWMTTSLRLTGHRAGEIVDVSVTADERRRWFLNGSEVPAVAGCVDLDLSFSAATNLIPLRRLSLAVGQRAEINSAWLTLPHLRLEPLPQTYGRTGESCYAYEAPRQRFATELEVHESGFVTRYPPLWTGAILDGREDNGDGH